LSPLLFVAGEPYPLPPKGERKRVALTLGGVANFKTYRQWPEVIRHLRGQWPAEKRFPQFILIGSQNGLQFVEPVKVALAGCEAVSLVDALSLRTTVQVLADCDFYLGADGGLMHCAEALKLSGVALFGNRVTPEIALPPHTTMKTLEDSRGVNHIPPQTVAENIRAQWESCPSWT
jgi:ADP-heptose:LPS heptosyltransferase